MWNIFQNALIYNIQADKCSVMMYADDHQAYTTGKRIEDVSQEYSELRGGENLKLV